MNIQLFRLVAASLILASVACSSIVHSVEISIEDKHLIASEEADAFPSTIGTVVPIALPAGSIPDGYDSLYLKGKLHYGGSAVFCPDSASELVRLVIENITQQQSTYPQQDELRRHEIGFKYNPRRGAFGVDLNGYPGKLVSGVSFGEHAVNQFIYSLDSASDKVRCSNTGVNEWTHIVDYSLFINAYNTVFLLKVSGAALAETYITSMSYGYGLLADQILRNQCTAACTYLSLYARWTPSLNEYEASPLNQSAWEDSRDVSVYAIRWQTVVDAMNNDWGAKAYPTRSPTLDAGSAAGAFLGVEAMTRNFLIH